MCLLHTGNQWAYRKGRERYVGGHIKAVHWTMIALSLLKMPTVTDLAVSARSTFEALTTTFLNLTLKEIAFDVSNGVVSRTAIRNCREKFMQGKVLVLIDPCSEGWNLTAKVEERRMTRICAEMRSHFGRYLANPGPYWQSQVQTCWPLGLTLPTAEDRRMAAAAGSRAAASAALFCWLAPQAAYATPPPPAAPQPQHHAAYPTPQHQPQVPPAPAAQWPAPAPAPQWPAPGATLDFPAGFPAGSAGPPPLPNLPFDAGQNIIFLQEESKGGIIGLRYEQVRLFTCEWRGTPGQVGKFSMSIPSTWSLAQGKIPVVLNLPGADDRRVFAPGGKSQLNDKAKSLFTRALVVECNASIPAGKKKPTWAYLPQPWMGDLMLFIKALYGTQCTGIGFSRGACWLIQLAGQTRIFDGLALIAPFPPPGTEDLVSAQQLTSMIDVHNVAVVGSDTDEFACTEAAHPGFWAYLRERGLRPWIKVLAGHQDRRKNDSLCCRIPDLSYGDPKAFIHDFRVVYVMPCSCVACTGATSCCIDRHG